MDFTAKLGQLHDKLRGDLFTDESSLVMYATDASAYREMPMAVARPKDKSDLLELIRFARENHIALIPRSAGTSLAGQVVGNGLVVDISKYITRVLEINEEEHWVRVEPGVVLDELGPIRRQHQPGIEQPREGRARLRHRPPLLHHLANQQKNCELLN